MAKSAPIESQFASFKALLAGHRLTPVQRRIAQTLAANVAQADYLTTSELAQLAGVSQPSVVRFAIALGFSGYGELRRALRDLGTPASPEAGPVERNKFQLAVAEEIANLTWLETWLRDPSDLNHIGAILADSRPLIVVGLRASQALARYFAFYARKVHPGVVQIGEAGSSAMDALHEASQLGARAMLAIAMPRWPRELPVILKAGRDLGLSVVGVTDQTSSPILDYVDRSITIPVGTTLLYDTHASALVVLSLIVEAIADSDPFTAEPSMESFETRAHAYRYFLSS
ncbi:MurR/RpiR family transcriptional regulator [Ferrimicrobium sp.]|uniref:MurR/RpiR family transcriptional regulator n=1 Tax=Ferrimicrobium sp. TaxID=2926050 RepID=UPI0026231C79|nr:MurR/RpiR family transcriptional regulator [Ferrimicrobium sp.]